MSAPWLDAIPHRPPLAAASERERKALADPQVRGNVLRFGRRWRGLREAAFAAGDFPAVRERVTEAKQRVLDRFDAVRAQFLDAARAAGWTVHEAADAPAARAVVERLAKAAGARLAVKTKSMVTEEIELGEHLRSAGIPCVETDLGEWIIQLAGEYPAHMVIPAVHLNRRQIAELFEKALGRPVDRDAIPEQVAQARRELRSLFVSAGIGISGANALIAPTGTVMMITNEGNGRLTTSLPPLHVVVAGLDKLLPDWASVEPLLSALVRSATGHRLTAYTSFLSGRGRPGQERHLVLVDNGRSAMRADPAFRDALRCIRCGACSNICPPFQVVGGHAFGHIYTGAIGLVNTPFHHGMEAAAGPQSLCAGCNACETVCPVSIPLPRMIQEVRARAAASRGLGLGKRLAFGLLARPRLFGAAARVAGWLRLTRLASRPLRARWKALVAETPPVQMGSSVRGMRVAYLAGCLTDRVSPKGGEAVVRVLRALGCEVVRDSGEHCCGLPALNSGDRATGLSLAERTLRGLDALGAERIVSGAPSCVAALVQDCGHLLPAGPVRDLQARVASRMIDFCSFVADVARPDPLPRPTGALPRVTIHDACQTAHALGLREPIRRVVRDLAGCEVVEMRESDACCGFGGSFSWDHAEVAREIASRKADAIEATGCGTVVSDNPGCLMHLSGVLAARGKNVRILHAAELLAERLSGA